ncbi:MAG TPA: hypothetical protein DIW81_14755 [Planctomycetaceae bacterium]|nr:hypothetical protein [Planctomycetaceae bacterium]
MKMPLRSSYCISPFRYPRAIATALCLLPVLYGPYSFAAGEAREGNEPLAQSNYESWPGLIETMSDQSRVHYWWVNGNETFSYSGTTQDLNRILKKFAQTDVPDLQVILLPGPARKVDFLETNATVDWDLHIVGGIVKGYIEHLHLEPAWDHAPTLTIYLSERIELSEIEIPENLKLLQLNDRREKYRQASRTEDAELKKAALYQWAELERSLHREKEAAAEFVEQLHEIDLYIQKQKKRRASLN